MLFCCSCQFKAKAAGFGRQGTDQSRKMDNLNTFLAKNPIQVKILNIECTAYFAGTVV